MNDLTISEVEKIKAGLETPEFEKLKPMLRPEGVIDGLITADPKKCSSCGLCIENCPGKALEMDKDGVPKKKDGYECFSCFNCMIACPKDALSISRTFKIEGGFFDTGYPPIKPPLECRNAEGLLAEWTETEKIILNRRSVRNYRNIPVPEAIINRILEAGRFAPSAGNHQPWKFVVVTDKQVINQLENACQQVIAGFHAALSNDEMVINLVKDTPVAVFDPRVRNGISLIAKKELKVFLDAPVVIFIATNKKLNAPELHAGICGQNMNIAANALGLGVCWSNFGTFVNFIPELLEKFEIEDPWKIQSTLCIGYPKFKQAGIVQRHFRPVTWLRQGSESPIIKNNQEGEKVAYTTARETFEKMSNVFDAVKATGINSIIQYVITGEGGGNWVIQIKDGTCSIEEAAHNSPNVTITMSSGTWLALVNKDISEMQAFMSGKLKAEGDVMIAQKISQIFPL